MFRYLLILFILVALNNNNNNDIIEGTSNTVCCGNIKQSLVDSNEAGDNPPHAVKRCFQSGFKYNNNPCQTVGSCSEACNNQGDDKCVPTTEGGYCEIGEDMMIYKNTSFQTIDDEKIGKKLNDINPTEREKYMKMYSNQSNPFEIHDPDRQDEIKKRIYTESDSKSVSIIMIIIGIVVVVVVVIVAGLIYKGRARNKKSKDPLKTGVSTTSNTTSATASGTGLRTSSDNLMKTSPELGIKPSVSSNVPTPAAPTTAAPTHSVPTPSAPTPAAPTPAPAAPSLRPASVPAASMPLRSASASATGSDS